MFVSRDLNTLLRAFIVYMRPLLEYASPVWNPHHKYAGASIPIPRWRSCATFKIGGEGNFRPFCEVGGEEQTITGNWIAILGLVDRQTGGQ